MSSPQFMLIVEARAGEADLARVRAAIDAVAFASAVIVPSRAIGVPATEPRFAADAIRPLVAALQSAGIAALVLSDGDLARSAKADGVHVVIDARGASREPDPSHVVATSRAAVGKGLIVGVEIVCRGENDGSRHLAMVAGEAGADYVAFSGPGARDLVSWWSEVFEVPSVAFGAGEATAGVAGPNETAELADAGADFVAVAVTANDTAADVQTAMKAHRAALRGASVP